MASLADIQSVEAQVISTPYNGLSMTKYLEAAAVSGALYDHMLTFGDEIKFIWSGKMTLSKILYITTRYGIEASLIFVAYNVRPSPVVKPSVLTVNGEWLDVNLYVTYHHYMLWDRRRGPLIAMLVGILATYIPATVLGLQSVLDYRKYIIYFSQIDQCLLVRQPDIVKGFWGCLVAYDVLAVAIAVLNSFHRPYRQRSDVLTSLRRDGAIWFLVIMTLRVANFALSATAPPQDVFIVVFNIWAFIAMSVARIILRIEGLKPRKSAVRVWNTGKNAFELDRFQTTSCSTNFH